MTRSSSWLKEPIHHKIIFLVVMLILLGMTLAGMEEAYRHATLKQERAWASQNALGNLSKVLLCKLSLIERDFVAFAMMLRKRRRCFWFCSMAAPSTMS